MKKHASILLAVFFITILLTKVAYCSSIPLFAKDASWLGSSIIDSVLAIIGLVLAIIGTLLLNEWYYYKKKQRHVSAMELHALIKSYSYDIRQIATTPDLYEYEGYYPFMIPEVSKKNVESHSVRPARLIFNRTQELRKSFDKFPHIGKEEYKRLWEYFKAVNDASRPLGFSLYAQKAHTKEIADEVKPTIKEGAQKIKEKSDEVLAWIMSIIEE